MRPSYVRVASVGSTANSRSAAPKAAMRAGRAGGAWLGGRDAQGGFDLAGGAIDVDCNIDEAYL
jgi:hypothetical protein